jgi:hypothetical protein
MALKMGNRKLYGIKWEVEVFVHILIGYLNGLTKNFCGTRFTDEESIFKKGTCIWYKTFDDRGNLIESFKSDDKNNVK